MPLFRPTALRRRAWEIDEDSLRAMGVKALLLDVDNTIAHFSSHAPMPPVLPWLEKMRQAGFDLIIVSNNYEKRVSAFARAFGLPWISFACKPFPFGYLRAARRMGLRPRDCAIVGDQIFTDVTGANLCGMKSILLSPPELEPGWSFRMRRYFERPLRAKYEAELGVRNEE